MPRSWKPCASLEAGDLSRSSETVYLERRSYRRRRVIDAIRMIPVLGLILFLVPLLGDAEPGSPRSTGGTGLYIFAVWGGLIFLTAALLWLLNGYESKKDKPKQ